MTGNKKKGNNAYQETARYIFFDLISHFLSDMRELRQIGFKFNRLTDTTTYMLKMTMSNNSLPNLYHEWVEEELPYRQNCKTFSIAG